MSRTPLRRRLPPAARRRLDRLVVGAVHIHGPRLASRLRMAWAIASNPTASVSFGAGCYLGPGFSLHAPWGGTFRCGAGSEFRRGFRAELAGPEATVEIGSGCYFTNNALIQCATTIAIGDRAAFGQSLMLVDGKHRFRDLDKPAVHQGWDFHPIAIGDDVMVLAKVTIVAGLRTRALVGANSVVTSEIPPYTVAVGTPARVIDYFGPPGQEPEGWSATRSSRSERSGEDGPSTAASSHASRK